LREWEEEELRECQFFLLICLLQDQSSDRWQWQSDSDKGFIVWGAYQLLTSQDSATMDDAVKLVWHSMFRWRSPSLLSVYCVTGCPQKQTWLLETYLLQLICVYLGAVRWSRLITYFSHLVLLVLFGH
jgi:hypothetical protein